MKSCLLHHLTKNEIKKKTTSIYQMHSVYDGNYGEVKLWPIYTITLYSSDDKKKK